MKQVVLLCLGLMSFFSCKNEVSESVKNTVGFNQTIFSTILNDTLEIQIHLPSGYERSQKKYPVLYLLDGQHNFLKGVTAMQTLSRFGYTPEFIVVGIKTEGDQRGDLFFDKSDQFIQSIKSELIAFLDNRYRTSSERMLFGWEAAGGFGLEVLTKNPELFSGYFMASPTPIYGSYFPGYKDKFLELKNTVLSSKVEDKYLFITQARQDYPVQYGISNLLKMLESEATSNFRWDYKKLNDEDHPTTPGITIAQGLRKYYFDYSYLRITDFEDFQKKGGLKFAKEFHEARVKKYNLNKEQELESNKRMKRSAVISAISSDNFEAFEFFMDSFKNQGFMDEQFLGHGLAYGEYYLQNNQPDNALETYDFLANKFDGSAGPINGIGDVHLFNNNLVEAKEFYEEAVEIGVSTDDWRLNEYQSDLDSLMNIIVKN